MLTIFVVGKHFFNKDKRILATSLTYHDNIMKDFWLWHCRLGYSRLPRLDLFSKLMNDVEHKQCDICPIAK